MFVHELAHFLAAFHDLHVLLPLAVCLEPGRRFCQFVLGQRVGFKYAVCQQRYSYNDYQKTERVEILLSFSMNVFPGNGTWPDG